ncbi:MAG: hypothetical protein M0Z37_06000 [Nitrospiraceae bacterium]|nr:hypothetical protein [Nitrospiraceae bacterium]
MEIQKKNRLLTGSFATGLLFVSMLLGACASLSGDRESRADHFRSDAQKLEATAGTESSSLNHLDASQKYTKAAELRLSAGREYAIMGNTARAKDQYEKASKDLGRGSTESLNIQGNAP